MAGHDNYGKELLARIFGSRFDRWSPNRNVLLAGIEIRLDGIITAAESPRVECAVEIEAENEPQVRGAILNLYLHPAPKVLLLLMPLHLSNSLQKALEHFQALWARLTGGERGRLPIICLEGDGNKLAWQADEARVRHELRQFGINL